MSKEITADFLLEQGFKMENGQYVVRKWSWRKFWFVKTYERDSSKTVFTKNRLVIIVDGLGSKPAIYIRLDKDKLVRFDNITESNVIDILKECSDA